MLEHVVVVGGVVDVDGPSVPHRSVDFTAFEHLLQSIQPPSPNLRPRGIGGKRFIGAWTAASPQPILGGHARNSCGRTSWRFDGEEGRGDLFCLTELNDGLKRGWQKGRSLKKVGGF